MIPCFNHDGMSNMIGWHVGELIFAKIDADAAAHAAILADPDHVPQDYVWDVKSKTKPKKSAERAFADYCEMIRARNRGALANERIAG